MVTVLDPLSHGQGGKGSRGRGLVTLRMAGVRVHGTGFGLIKGEVDPCPAGPSSSFSPSAARYGASISSTAAGPSTSSEPPLGSPLGLSSLTSYYSSPSSSSGGHCWSSLEELTLPGATLMRSLIRSLGQLGGLKRLTLTDVSCKVRF